MKLKFLFGLFAFLFVVAIQDVVFAQARLVIGNTSAVFMNISGGAYLVVGDATASAATNTIMYTDALARNSWIISEGNGTINNRIKWYIGNAAAASTYTVPLGRGTTNYIPVVLTIGAAGTAGGSFVFSTYRTASWQNSANLPTTGGGVGNYNSSSIPGDASAYGVDRFWEIDATGYGASKPDLSALMFTYIDGGGGNPEISGGSNTITEANIQAQRWNFNAATPGWQGPGNTFLKGVDGAASNTVTISGAANVVSGSLDLANSRWWTLHDNAKPLPVEFLRESAECNHKEVVVKWSTASEQNSDFFMVERSLDGTNFSPIAKIPAAGNSSVIKNYYALDTDPYSGTSFYRVREQDFNTSSMTSGVMTVNGCTGDDVFVYGTEGGLAVNINALEDGQYNVELYDMLGQKLVNEVKNVVAGNNHLKLSVGNISSAIYLAKVYNSSNAVTKKVFIRSSYTQ